MLVEQDAANDASGKRLPKLNDNQLAVMAELAGRGGRELVRELRGLMSARGVPDSTLGTLVRRGLVRFEETAQAFHVTSLQQDGKKFAHEHVLNEAQTEALGTVVAAMEKGGFRPHLLYGITGSGKTAVYVAANAASVGGGQERVAAGPGNWADARHRRADGRGVWRRGRPSPLATHPR